MSADDLNRSIREAWFEFYSVRRMVQGLGRTRAPVTKGNLTLWALNLGINKIMRRIAATSGPVRTTEMPMSVFDTLPPSSRWPNGTPPFCRTHSADGRSSTPRGYSSFSSR